MPERSFGRTVRYRRTKLGLSQAKLGELVGRSPATVRSWERDKSAPSETAVLHALAAILGVDERSLFEKAGQEPPADEESHPTLEEALASLEHRHKPQDEPTSDHDDETHPDTAATAFDPGDPPEEGGPPSGEQPVTSASTPAAGPVYTRSSETYVVTSPTPPFVEPSYIEDERQRQLYRVRNLATLAVAVALVITLMWALSETLDALGAWWDEFFGGLRL